MWGKSAWNFRQPFQEVLRAVGTAFQSHMTFKGLSDLFHCIAVAWFAAAARQEQQEWVLRRRQQHAYGFKNLRGCRLLCSAQGRALLSCAQCGAGLC
jgi:hypothetical protein